MVVSCDLVSDIPLQNVFDLHRTHQSTVTALFSQSPPEMALVSVPGPKTKFKPGKIICHQVQYILKLNA